MLAFLNDEFGKGYEKVKELLDCAVTGEINLCMSLVNLVEVYYRIIQLKGLETADAAMEPVKSLPIRFISVISEEIYLETARCKARYPIALADAFLCGTAKCISATIVTRDPEIRLAEKSESLSVLWII
ncbi:MAG: type II toxin-antitoxin system VapC family toxin [Treponema sp.]|nr:type II toxin-antitoxin system VapC family toxin [Treponema sp.]